MADSVPKHELDDEDRRAIRDFFESKGLPTDIDLTYGDVDVPEQYSDIRSRSRVEDLSVPFTPHLKLNIPLVSANMEPVTGPRMMVAMEREGGLGFLPQSLPLETRLAMLEQVLRADCAVIDDPLTVLSTATLREAKEKMAKLGVSGAIVLAPEGDVAGILSSRDWRYEEDESKKVSDLMTHSSVLWTAPYATSFEFENAAKILRENKIEKLPLVEQEENRFILRGLITARGLFYKSRHPLALRDDRGRFIRVGTVGVGASFSDAHLQEVEAQMKKGIKVLLIDTARAFSVNTGEAIRRVREAFGSDLDLVVGNVSSAAGAKFLFEMGADCVKVGQGPGEACRTRDIGIGVPQLTAVAECGVIARRYGKTIIADGGIKSSADVTKALIAGANSVMLGFLLAGTEESEAKEDAQDSKEYRTEIRVKPYYGSASHEAQQQRIGRGNLDHERRPEGVSMVVPVVGTVAWRVNTLLHGLRSAMSYVGARTIAEFQEKGVFRRQSNAGLVEGTKKP